MAGECQRERRRRTVRNPPLPLPSGKSDPTRAIRSDEDYGLRIRDLEFGAAARVRAEEHIVYANQVIAGFRELGPVKIACAARQFLLPRAPHPPDLEFVCLTALRTRISGRFRFLLLVVIISFVHSRRSLHRKRPSTPNVFTFLTQNLLTMSRPKLSQGCPDIR